MTRRFDADAVGVHQILAAASPGDAITNMALATRAVLRGAGPSEVFARHVDPSLLAEVLPLSAYRSPHHRNVLLFHASIGQPEVYQFLAHRSEPIVLVYHNVTPARYFEPYDMQFAQLLEFGRREIELLRPRVVRAIAVSEYNARELEVIGYDDVTVVPPVMHVGRLAAVAPRASTVHHLRSFRAPILLSVAQLMPHKRPDFLVEMMHCTETYGIMRPVLLLVGHQRLERFTRAIREQIRELGVTAHLVGPVDDADLVAMFREAAVVVSASEHEGFCIPLVEAMSFGTPIVARSCAAVPETVRDAGLLVAPVDGPAVFGEAVAAIVDDPALRADLVERGTRRVAELEALRPGDALVEALLEVV
jgi:glycosyltransferase involved in cell wall biosynthesis